MRLRAAIGGLAILASAACGDAPARLPLAGTASDGIVFVAGEAGNLDVARARVADGARLPLTRTPERAERWPYWSERGQRLVFQVAPAAPPPGERPDSDLVILEAADGRERRLATPEREEHWPAWSPDGMRLAYAFRGGRPANGIALRDVASDATQLLASADGRGFLLRPHFAPDGARLVAQRRSADGTRSSLWVLAPDAAPRALTDDPAWFDQKASFSSDGAWVVYTRRRGDEPRDLAHVAAAGGEPQALTRTPDVDEHSAAPSPLGAELAFVSDRDGSSDVFLLDPASGAARNLTATPELDEFAPHWSPDGQRLLLTVAPVGTTRDGRPLASGTGDATGEPGDGGPVGTLRVRVVDRSGAVLLDVPGMMPDWMPGW